MQRYIHYFITAILLSVFFLSCKDAKKKETNNTENPAQETSSSSSKSQKGDTYLLTFEFKTNLEGTLKPAGHMKWYVSEKAFRSEMEMKVMGQEMKMQVLGFPDKPNESILLNDADKTYSIINSDELEENLGMGDFSKYQKETIEIVGEEKMSGYASTHVRVTTQIDMPGMSGVLGDEASTVSNYWMSKKVPGYSIIEKIMKKNPKILGANKGTEAIYKHGIPVKQIDSEKDVESMVVELISAEKTKISKEKFEIPKGYTEIED